MLNFKVKIFNLYKHPTTKPSYNWWQGGSTVNPFPFGFKLQYLRPFVYNHFPLNTKCRKATATIESALKVK